MRCLTILFVFISFQISVAQNYVPFPDSNAAWHSYTWGIDGITGFYKTVLSNQDTVINSLTYRKMFSPINYRGAMRQNVGEKKVYFVTSGAAEEQLLYDFNLQVGDTVPDSYLGCYPYAWVVSIDSTNQYGGIYRKVYHFESITMSGIPDLVEGIGCMAGVLDSYCQGELAMNILDCFSVENSLIYWNGAPFADCAIPWLIPHCSDTTYLPTITASAPLTICYGDTILLEAESGYDAYLWSTGDTTQSISVSDSGDYSVSVLVDTCWFGSDTVEISVSNPQPIVTANANDLISSGPFVSYQWYHNDEPIIIDGIYQIYHVVQCGNYHVIVTDEFGCIGSSYIIEGMLCGAMEDISNSVISIYPNPTTSTITLEFPTTATFKNAELSIQTITGQVVFQSAIQNPKSAIDVNGFSKGLYLFKVRAGDEVVVRKVIIEY